LAEKALGFGVPADRIAIVANGVDRSLFFPRDRSQARRELSLPEGRVILFVGRLESAKGVQDLLQAFDQIAPSSPELRLAVVGDGREMSRCREAEAKWPGRVFLPGAQPLAEVARWTAACDVLTLPSWNEGTPNVVLEALASGRRVVATRVGGIPDLLSRTALGEMVSPRCPDELAQALARVAHQSYDPIEVAAAGPPGWDSSAHLLHQVLLSACDGSDLPDQLRVSAGQAGQSQG
jgi:glycosyltransferase involved in cell wall biosynthesis